MKGNYCQNHHLMEGGDIHLVMFPAVPIVITVEHQTLLEIILRPLAGVVMETLSKVKCMSEFLALCKDRS